MVKALAASCFFDVLGMASAQEYSQAEPLSVSCCGAKVKPTLSATLLCEASVTKEPATVASTHMAHLPVLNSARFSLKPLLEAPGGPYLLSRST